MELYKYLQWNILPVWFAQVREKQTWKRETACESVQALRLKRSITGSATVSNTEKL